MRIIYFGTPEFAVAGLEGLMNAGFDIVAVVTVPDKPSGRGMKLQCSAVKKFAIEKGLVILQPVDLKEERFLQTLLELKPDLQIVVAFRILPEIVWSLPSHGTYNLHASLLPQYRGAAPIQHVIMRGEKLTGVTTFKLAQGMDTGSVALQQTVKISEEMNGGELHDLLMEVGSSLLVRTVGLISQGKLELRKQETAGVQLIAAPRLFRQDMEINWKQTGCQIINHIRALAPKPGATCEVVFLDQTTLSIKILNAKFVADGSFVLGNIETGKQNYFHIGCIDGWIEVLEMQAAGKGKMAVRDFLRGNNLAGGKLKLQ